MSSINTYKHQHIGFFKCPSTFDFINNNPTRQIAIYKLLENIPTDETDFDGKAGDIILGGGSGEAPAFRISMPETLYFLAKEGWDDFEMYDDLFKAFWKPTQTYILCEGFSKIGWTPDLSVEYWLAKNICRLVANKTHFVPYILEQYQNGQRYFADLDLENEIFDKQNLQDVVFENCLFYSSFRGANLRNSKFINGNIKTCDFRESNLTNAHFENLSVESSQFARAKTNGIYFDNNWAYGQKVTQADFDSWIKNHEENL